jgi:uncharacterized protein YegP (UPF0339 family)
MWFEIYGDSRGQFRWRLWADNDVDKIADSASGYDDRGDCERAVNLVQSTTHFTPIEDKSSTEPQGLWGRASAPRAAPVTADRRKLADALAALARRK